MSKYTDKGPLRQPNPYYQAREMEPQAQVLSGRDSDGSQQYMVSLNRTGQDRTVLTAQSAWVYGSANNDNHHANENEIQRVMDGAVASPDRATRVLGRRYGQLALRRLTPQA